MFKKIMKLGCMGWEQHPSYSAALCPYFLFRTQEGAVNPPVHLHDPLGGSNVQGCLPVLLLLSRSCGGF